MGDTVYKAFVSSTYEDLKAHRAYVIDALRNAGMFVDPMEDWTAESDEPKAFSAERVQGCDFCVLLVAFRRGYVPEGETSSITQLEYQAALDHGVDVLVFLLDENAPWPRRFDEMNDVLKQWRLLLERRHGRSTFGLDPSTIKIAPAVTRWVAKQSRKATEVGSDWISLVSNILGLPKNEPKTWEIAAALLPYALAAVEQAYHRTDATPLTHRQVVPQPDTFTNSQTIKSLLAKTSEFFDESPARFETTCFVIMPFGEKRVGDVVVDFDRVYREIFAPAVARAQLPDGRPLVIARADADFFSGDINDSTFRYLEYARFAICDITAVNPNVFYELGVRHRARSSGTAIFRQTDAPIPFDINQIRAFAYDPNEPDQSRELITRVITESLAQARVDSPIHLTQGVPSNP